MLAPALATMLVVLTTDAAVTAADCDRALRNATRTTFDRLDSDGCQSTNDTVVLLASAASGIRPDSDAFAAACRGAERRDGAARAGRGRPRRCRWPRAVRRRGPQPAEKSRCKCRRPCKHPAGW